MFLFFSPLYHLSPCLYHSSTAVFQNALFWVVVEWKGNFWSFTACEAYQLTATDYKNLISLEKVVHTAVAVCYMVPQSQLTWNFVTYTHTHTRTYNEWMNEWIKGKKDENIEWLWETCNEIIVERVFWTHLFLDWETITSQQPLQ